MIKEFKEFAMRGNLVETAVAFVMGAAFGRIVSAFVDGMVMPLVGLATSGKDFSDLKLIIKQGTAEVKDAGGIVLTEATPEIAIQYGTFVTVTLDFLIVAFAVFLVVKAINKMKKEEDIASVAPPEPSKEEVLLSEIRDILKSR